MATLTIKNIPDLLYNELKQQAALNHRSLNSEAIVSLAQAVHPLRPNIERIVLKARELRIKSNPTISLTNDLINEIKQQGRS